MDKVIIRDLVARGIMGVTKWERERHQEIRMNLVLYTDTSKPGKSDSIKDCVNYATVSKEILRHAENAGRYTVEALAGDIADLCLSMEGVEKVMVRVEKPGAVRFAQSVGVEIERSRH